ncbi:MAG: sugar phosphate isomerase/epimerase [Clostridiales bacterium]|nr:sugar phosphate isomerase/epimerase [Clostridiales bacterium]
MAEFVITAFADEASDSLDGQIKALARNGIKYIEPRSMSGSVCDKTDDELKEIKKKLDGAGIKVSSLGSPIGKYKIEDDFAPHFEKFKRALRVCEIFETPLMRMFSFFVKPEDYDKYRGEVMSRLSAMLTEAKAHGVTLCHENESDLYGQNPERVADLLDTLPELYAVFDAANYVMNGQDAVSGMTATLKRLKYMHVKDALATERKIVAAGEGDGAYSDAIERANAYTNERIYLTVEPHLFEFAAYSRIDSHTLSTVRTFNGSDESFDFAVESLKKLLIELGYKEENYVWKK